MPGLNRQWAIEELEGFLKLIETENRPNTSLVGRARSGDMRAVYKNEWPEMQAAAQIVEQILERVIPRWRDAPWQVRGTMTFSQHRLATIRALAQLRAQDKLDKNMGSTAPQLDASTLHPWVWGSVQGLWSSGHYREAVGAAAKAINAQAQAKVGRRDLSEAKLLSNAFSTHAPTPNEPRLRLMSNDGSETFKNRHDGAGNYARGVYGAIRNPIAHEVDVELSEHEALEQLAAFSILARWIDAATVEVVP